MAKDGVILGDFFKATAVKIYFQQRIRDFFLILTGVNLCQGVAAQQQDLWSVHLKQLLVSKELTWDEDLERCAYFYAQELKERGVLSHRDRQGRAAAARAVLFGVKAGQVGELLASGADWQAVLRGWQESPSHRALLEEPGWVRWAAVRTPYKQSFVYIVLLWKNIP